MKSGFDHLIRACELTRVCDDLRAGACGGKASTEALDACLTVLLTAGDCQGYVDIRGEVEAGSGGFPTPSGATAAGVALAKLMTGTYRSVREYCRQALDVFPDAPGLLAMSAHAAFAFKRYEECFGNASLSIDRGYWPGAKALAIASAAKTGRSDVAQRLLEEAETQGPPMWMEVAEGLHLTGDHEGAALVVPDLLEALPDAVEVHMLAGAIEMGRRNWGEAALRYRFVLEAAPRHHFAASRLLAVLARAHDWKEAAVVAHSLLDRMPYHALVGFWTILSYTRRGRFVRSWRQLRACAHTGAQLRAAVDRFGALALMPSHAPELRS